MSKPNESRPGRAKQLGIRLAAVSGVALVAAIGILQLPLGATAGVATAAAPADDRVVSQLPPTPPPPVTAAASRQKAPGTYRLRCWQYGRLLFEERDLQVPLDVVGGLKLRGTDRNRQPVYVADTGSSTCLIRSTPPVRR